MRQKWISRREDRAVSRAVQVAVALLAVSVPLTTLAQNQQPVTQKTLYQRLGGYDAIAAVTDDFIRRLASDPKFTRFFSGLSADSKVRLRQHVVEQLCHVAGGPCFYPGRTMKESHAGLSITGAKWQTSVAHLSASLDMFHVPKHEKDDVLGAVGTMRADIVEK